MPRAHTAPARHVLALPPSEAAAAIGVSLNTLNGWIAAGEIQLCRPVAPGGKEMKLVRMRELEAFLDRYQDHPTIAGRRRTA